ncbi:MAG TPA: DUF2202 domain-containing protein [Anaerolineaceae bacterium]|nr:DUF2202 domain-containing protein [Anaerolineaceae bacterium]
MDNKKGVTSLTRNNWLMDLSLFLAAIVTVLSGIYFLFLPDGGFKGGRNPFYGIRILFLRETWEWLHTWIGLAMVVIALVHILFHWKWVKSTFKRIASGASAQLNPRARYNLWLNTLTALSFLISALSGLYFLFTVGSEGGRNPDPMFLFSRTAWDVLHTWSSVVFIASVILHFAIHWRWIVNVTKKVFQRSVTPRVEQTAPALFTKNFMENLMFKKSIGIALLVVVIGLLAFGAINRTSANAGEILPAAADEVAGYGNGNGQGNGQSEAGTLAPAVPAEEHTEEGCGVGLDQSLIETLPLGELSQAETDGLLFMYEEEKLARDVYTYFTTLYTQPMFSNIASSEQTHMDSVKTLLDRYNLTAPVADTVGVFNNTDFQQLYTDLTKSGGQSLAEALLAGAAIEEIDILDLKQRLAQVDQDDIQQVYESLLFGSYNHLNAFSSVYANQTGAAYTPQYMDEAQWTEFQTYLAENGLFSGSGGRGRRNGGGSGTGTGGGGGRR